MRANNLTPIPGPTILPSGTPTSIPSRDPGREIPCRIFKPERGPPKGIFYHIHGGGWVLFSESHQDPLLKFLADTMHVTVISIGYRLAPENPYPAGPNDCLDVAQWLVDNDKSAFGAELLFIGGESAGAHLSVATCFKLIETRPNFAFRALVLNYGAFDLTMSMPQIRRFDVPLVLTRDEMAKYVEAFTPGMTIEQRRDPAVSPLFADLPGLARRTRSGRLPPCFFSIGTMDLLLDDSMSMAMRWLMGGAEAVLKVYPGAPHGFTLDAPNVCPGSGEYRRDVIEFLSGKMSVSAVL